jgi:hypothetical protein
MLENILIFLQTLIPTLFLLSGVYLVMACVIVANRMDELTKPILKLIMGIIIIGAAGQLMLLGYNKLSLWAQLVSIPISLGVASWLIINRYGRRSPAYPLAKASQ